MAVAKLGVLESFTKKEETSALRAHNKPEQILCQTILTIRVSVVFLRRGRNDPGYASLPACSLGEKPIDQNQAPTSWRLNELGSGSYKCVFRRDCTLEAMRTQGARKTLTHTLTILNQRRFAAAMALTF